IVLASYAVFYFGRGGPTYEQWKWISYLQPLMVVAVIAPVAVLIVVLAQRPLATVAVAIGLVALITASTVSANRDTSLVDSGSTWVPVDLGDLGAAPVLRGVDEVNIALTPYWESMWAAEALWPRRVHLLTPTYYPVTAPDAAATIVRRADIP